MSGEQDHVSKSSSSSISTSTQESEEEVSVTIGSLLAQAKSSSGHSLGKRLPHLGSIPYTPRVNGKIPNFDNATLDHERLLERLGTYGLAEFQIEGDGNCQVYFSSTSVHFIIPYIKYIMLHHQHGSLLAACNLALS
jgi:hypothetical protein